MKPLRYAVVTVLVALWLLLGVFLIHWARHQHEQQRAEAAE